MDELKFPKIKLGIGTYMPEPRIGLGEEPTFIRYYNKCPVLCDDSLTIGNYCSISHGVNFLLPSCGADHQGNSISTFPLQSVAPFPDNARFYVRPRTQIGNDVWIGQNAIILPGVEIGNGVIVGAYTVVSKSVPDYAVIVGNPAKVVRLRYTLPQIESLNKIQWWNWELSFIKDNIRDFYLPIEDFIRKYST